MIRSALRVMTKLIYTVEHISISTKAKFLTTIGVGVVISVVSEWWFSKDIRRT